MDQLVLDQHTMALLDQIVYNQEQNQLSKREQVALTLYTAQPNVYSSFRNAFDAADRFLEEGAKRK